MRLLVFFDLPTETAEDKRNYRHFRKFLIREGFIMLQESVYTRMLITPTAGQSLLSSLRKNKPPNGLVQVLSLTEKQFEKMEFITGEYCTEVIDTDEKTV